MASLSRSVAIDLDLEIAFYPQLIQALPEDDGDGVCLLACGAADHPDTYGLFAFLVLQQMRYDFIFQNCKGIRFPEKAGHADEELFEEQIDLRRIFR